MTNFKLLWVLAFTVALSACGGGASQVVPSSTGAEPIEGGYSDNPSRDDQAEEGKGVEVLGAGDQSMPEAGGRLEGNPLTDEEMAAEKAQSGQLEQNEQKFTPEVYFGYDEHQISEEGLKVIQHYAQFLIDQPSNKVTLIGNTDERGTPEYNLALGEKRAKSVEEAFMLYGVPESQIEVITMGEESPAVDAHNEAAWAKNRRVDIKIH